MTMIRKESTLLEEESGPVLLPVEVGRVFGVSPATVVRWAKRGRIPAIKTIGGHHRFRESDVRRVLAEMGRRAAP